MNAWLPLLIGLVGIASTIIAWKLNPRRILQDKLDSINASITKWEEKQNEALSKNDNDALNIAAGTLRELRSSKAIISKRLSTLDIR